MRSCLLLLASACAASAGSHTPAAFAQAQIAPAHDQVQNGVDAWQIGEFDAAVRHWMPAAASGNADAQFNMGQAYKLGRGVITSLADSEIWFRRAAQQGHLQAEDNLGLILFTMGKQDEAMPFVRHSAARGEARAQFLLGTAHYNGDFAEKNWPMAYALITRASETGLSLAKNRISQLDQLIPAAQRAEGRAMLPLIRQNEEMARRAVLPSTAPLSRATAPSPATPQPSSSIRQIELPAGPSSQISQATTLASGSDPLDPAQQSGARSAPGVTFTPPPLTSAPAIAAAPTSAAESQAVLPTPTPTPPTTPQAASSDEVTEAPSPGAAITKTEALPFSLQSPSPAAPLPAPTAPTAQSTPATTATSSSWRAQLGAFAILDNARNLWNSLSPRHTEFRGKTPHYIPSGRVTRLLVSGFSDQQQAADFCANLRAQDQECIVVSQ